MDAANPTGSSIVLDIHDRIVHSFEQGIMDFTFNPSFDSSGVFYVSYAAPGKDVSSTHQLVWVSIFLSF